jgi:hypothetical protein
MTFLRLFLAPPFPIPFILPYYRYSSPSLLPLYFQLEINAICPALETTTCNTQESIVFTVARVVSDSVDLG